MWSIAILTSIGPELSSSLGLVREGMPCVSLAACMSILRASYGTLTPASQTTYEATMHSVNGRPTMTYIADVKSAFTALGGESFMTTAQLLAIFLKALTEDGRYTTFLELFRGKEKVEQTFAALSATLISRVQNSGDFTPVARSYSAGGSALAAGASTKSTTGAIGSGGAASVAISPTATLKDLLAARTAIHAQIDARTRIHWCATHSPTSSHSSDACNREASWHTDPKWCNQVNWNDAGHPRRAKKG